MLSAETKRLNSLQLFSGKNYKIPAVAWSKYKQGIASEPRTIIKELL